MVIGKVNMEGVCGIFKFDHHAIEVNFYSSWFQFTNILTLTSGPVGSNTSSSMASWAVHTSDQAHTMHDSLYGSLLESNGSNGQVVFWIWYLVYNVQQLNCWSFTVIIDTYTGDRCSQTNNISTHSIHTNIVTYTCMYSYIEIYPF